MPIKWKAAMTGANRDDTRDITVMSVPALLPYQGSLTKFEELTPDDLLALCIYRGGPHAVSTTFVRGRMVWNAKEPELF